MQKVAPWLTLDGDPYPAVVERPDPVDHRRLHDQRRLSVQRAQDAGQRHLRRRHQTAQNRVQQGQKQINYIRNSVKATVDAYDGTVTLYQFGAKDPVLKTWMKAFPGIVKPQSAMSTDLGDTCATPRTCSRCSAT